ncbi:MAG: hypothetical protein ACE5FJ_10270 [Gemmatimonadales bacterium]
MFIELAEHIRCPADHAAAHCVVAPDVIEGRRIVAGTVGCPVCRREYHIAGGRVNCGTQDRQRGGGANAGGDARWTADRDGVPALLGLDSPGGYVVLYGGAALLASALARSMEGIHFVGVNAPSDLEESESLSLIDCRDTVPLASAFARGACVGSEPLSDRRLAQVGGLVLAGQRLVVPSEGVSVAGYEELATAPGMWVGRRVSPGTFAR